MTGKSHLSVGIGLGITTFVLNYESTNDFLYSSLICTGCIIGSLLPDIDSGKSMMSQHFLFLPKLIKKIFGHRGFIHSPLFIFALYYLLSHSTNLQVQQLGAGLAIGMISHLVLDLFTKMGIPIFFPIWTKKISFSSMKTGSKAEPIVALILFFIMAGGLIYLKQFL